jgi:hypothetical protein
MSWLEPLTEEEKAEYVQPGTEKLVMYQHGRILAQRRIWHWVHVQGDFTKIWVLPTAYTKMSIPIRMHLYYAGVHWDKKRELWSVSRQGGNYPIELGPVTWHKTLKSALNVARRFVEKHASEPRFGWRGRIKHNLRSVESPYPTRSDREYTISYWQDVANEQQRELYGFAFSSDDDLYDDDMWG